MKKKIKPEDIEIYNSSFIDARFRNQESDIVYKKKEQQIFFLVEFQSRKDYSMPRRILNYQIEIMELAMKDKRRMKKDERLPLIIPIVVYTGKGKWNVVNDIKDCQEQLEGYTNMGLGSYIVIDNNDYIKQELLNDESLIFKMMALERTKDPDKLYNDLKEIVKKETEASNKDILSQIIKYIYIETLGEEKAKDIINEINKNEEGSDEEMFIDILKKDREQQWQKGRQEGEKIGEKRGEKIGIAKAIVQMVKEMVSNNITDEQIMKIAKIDEKELQRLKEA